MLHEISNGLVGMNNDTCSKVTQESEAHSDSSKKGQTIQLSEIPSSQGPSESGTSFHSGIPEPIHLRHSWMALAVALMPGVTCHCLL